ncbi:DUF3592 domain-containing protein [Streptomyces sp. NPDC001691]|uniref:DUF3592 domain-containing protein n=1 Tax=unclassified Streptomyces TaxID=2593676 RepID=UPI0016734933|nr:DUF3592 domain-containing protein [Streptomyces sp. SDr-06]
MFAVGGIFGVVFGSVGLLFVAVGLGALVWVARTVSEHKRTLREGLRAGARCLETHVVRTHTSGGATRVRRRLIVGFRTVGGREVRARVTSRHPYVAGDVVPVRYVAHRPERAVADEAPTGVGVVACLFGGAMVAVMCMGLFFAAVGFGAALFAGTAADDGAPAPLSDPYLSAAP